MVVTFDAVLGLWEGNATSDFFLGISLVSAWQLKLLDDHPRRSSHDVVNALVRRDPPRLVFGE
jgi:hypothetical protein